MLGPVNKEMKRCCVNGSGRFQSPFDYDLPDAHTERACQATSEYCGRLGNSTHCQAGGAIPIESLSGRQSCEFKIRRMAGPSHDWAIYFSVYLHDSAAAQDSSTMSSLLSVFLLRKRAKRRTMSCKVRCGTYFPNNLLIVSCYSVHLSSHKHYGTWCVWLLFCEICWQLAL